MLVSMMRELDIHWKKMLRRCWCLKKRSGSHFYSSASDEVMRVILRWSVSGDVFHDVVCDEEEWGTVLRGDRKDWSCVPTRKLYVVRPDGLLPLEGLFLAAGDDVTLFIYAPPATFQNALSAVNVLPHGERRWRLEFTQHVDETFYAIPEHWGKMTVETQNFWILRMVQVWAGQVRVRFQSRFPRCGSDGRVLRFIGRYRHAFSELFAERFHVSDEVAEEEFLLFESINDAAHSSLTTFLWMEENQFHCFVR